MEYETVAYSKKASVYATEVGQNYKKDIIQVVMLNLITQI